MPGTDLTALLSAWVQDAIDSACMGEEFGYTVITGLMPVPGGELPCWAVVVTMRHPLFGHAPLAGKVTIPAAIAVAGDPEPVRENVHQMMSALRQQSRAVLAGLRNGGPAKIPLPPGLAQGN